MDCIFCKIIKKEIPAHIIYEDEKTLAFLDIHPRTEGHTMVISKFHAENIVDLPLKEIAPLFETVKKMAELLKNKLKPAGFTIGINHGRVSGQLVDHLHVHIIPRYANDGGSSLHAVVNYPPRETLEKIKEKILN
jgi:histidine triad (HIT) family protein